MFKGWSDHEKFPLVGSPCKPLLYKDVSNKEWIILLTNPPKNYLYDISNDVYIAWCHPSRQNSNTKAKSESETESKSSKAAVGAEIFSFVNDRSVDYRWMLINKSHTLYSLTPLYTGLLFVSISIRDLHNPKLLCTKLIAHCSNGPYPDFINFSHVSGDVNEFNQIHLGTGPHRTDHYVVDTEKQRLEAINNPVALDGYENDSNSRLDNYKSCCYNYNFNLEESKQRLVDNTKGLENQELIFKTGKEQLRKFNGRDGIKFEVGQNIDVRDNYQFGRYILSTIIELKYLDDGGDDGDNINSKSKSKKVQSVKVHYEGFDSKWDEWIDILKKEDGSSLDGFGVICDCIGMCRTSKLYHRIAPAFTQSIIDRFNQERREKEGDLFLSAHFFYTSRYHRLYGILPNKNIWYKKIYPKNRAMFVIRGFINNNCGVYIDNNRKIDNIIYDLIMKYYFEYCDAKWNIDKKNTYVRMPARWGKFGCLLLKNEKEALIFGGSIANLAHTSDIYKYNIGKCNLTRIIGVKHPSNLNNWDGFGVDMIYSSQHKSIHLLTKKNNKSRSHLSHVVEKVETV